MPTVVIFEIMGAKKDKIFNFLKGRLGSPMDVISGVFSDTYVRLLECITSHFYSFKI